jgi:polysaccharide export outer membrane protein
MKKNIYLLSIVLGLALLMSSCYSKKRIMYFYDLKDDTTWSATIPPIELPTFQKSDKISIVVHTIDKGTSDLLNTGILVNSVQSEDAGGAAIGGENKEQKGYTVDEYGDIYLPYIGKVRAEGLTKTELKNEIAKQIGKYVKDPIVYVDWINFKYTIIGEGGSGVYTVEDDKINVIEAVAKSGDFKPFAERDKVMLFREENGTRKMVRLDFQNSSIFSSPYFYIKQNDIICIEPRRFADPSPERQIRQVTLITSILSFTSIISNVIITWRVIK